MKTLILTIIALVLVFIFLVVAIYGDDMASDTDERLEKYRQQLNDWQDNDNNLNED